MNSDFKYILENLITAAESGNSGRSRQAAENIAEEYNTTNCDIQEEYDRQRVISQAYMCKLRNVWKIRRTI